jgi:hypothetical protein
MNNKRGGFGAKFLLVLILMIASAVGGAYGYSVLDGKMAINDAKKEINSLRISDYDTEEAVIIQGYIDDANKDLETAKTRKDVYEIMDDFKSDVDDVMTKTEKELEEARRANSNNNNNNTNNNNDYNTDITNPTDQNGTDDTQDDDNNSGGLFGNFFGGNSNDSSDSDGNL